MAGTCIQLGNRTIGPDDRLMQGYGVGLISSYNVNDKNSIDLNVQYYDNLGAANSFIINVDFGSYSLLDKIPFFLGLGFQTTVADPIITILPGFALERSENYALAFTSSFTLYGADIHTNPQVFGFGLSVTGFWD